MRAAFKFAGNVINGGLRGAPAVSPAEQSLRKSSIPVSTILSSSSASHGVKAAASDVVPTQRPVSELEEWDFAGDEGELKLLAGEPLPRVVCERTPSFQEAKKATDYLKDVIDTVYLSSPISSASGELAPQISDLSLGFPSISTIVLKAFTRFCTSTVVQNVVASVASDQNVWAAMKENAAFKEFMQSNQTITEFQGPVISEIVEESSTRSRFEGSGNWFSNVSNRIKLIIVDLVSNVSGFLDKIFGDSSDINGDAKATSFDKMTLGNLLPLAVLVAMVILLKRALFVLWKLRGKYVFSRLASILM